MASLRDLSFILTSYRRRQDSPGWVKTLEVSFDNEFFRISLFKQSIFLSGPKINAVLEYQQDNQTKHYHQLAYDVTSFDMYWPHIGPCDEEGNLLVIDELNGRFAILMADKSWQKLQVKRRCRPCDVALDKKRRVLVLNFDERSLCKLVPRPKPNVSRSAVDDVVKNEASRSRAEVSTLAYSIAGKGGGDVIETERANGAYRNVIRFLRIFRSSRPGRREPATAVRRAAAHDGRRQRDGGGPRCSSEGQPERRPSRCLSTEKLHSVAASRSAGHRKGREQTVDDHGARGSRQGRRQRQLVGKSAAGSRASSTWL